MGSGGILLPKTSPIVPNREYSHGAPKAGIAQKH
jgi:hypothetical protein